MPPGLACTVRSTTICAASAPPAGWLSTRTLKGRHAADGNCAPTDTSIRLKASNAKVCDSLVPSSKASVTRADPAVGETLAMTMSVSLLSAPPTGPEPTPHTGPVSDEPGEPAASYQSAGTAPGHHMDRSTTNGTPLSDATTAENVVWSSRESSSRTQMAVRVNASR